MSNCHISQTVTCKQSNLKEKWEFHTRSPGQSAITILFLFKMLYIRSDQIRSVAQSCPTLCNPTNRSTPGLPVCPSPTPGVHWDSRPWSQWCHPAISRSVFPFSSCPQSLPASESFPMSQLFAWGGQSIGVSALASFLPKKSQGWSPTEWTG